MDDTEFVRGSEVRILDLDADLLWDIALRLYSDVVSCEA
jgi:hypothetical protein